MTKPSGKDEWYADRRVYKQPKYRVKYMRGRTREDRLVAYTGLVLSTMEGIYEVRNEERQPGSS